LRKTKIFFLEKLNNQKQNKKQNKVSLSCSLHQFILLTQGTIPEILRIGGAGE
jgi:hypothetical protein